MFLLRKRLKAATTAAVLIILVVLCYTAGEYLRQKIQESRETVGDIQRNENMVVIDAGHGGKDPGKIAVNESLEKEINLEIALKIKKNLEKENIEVVMTRTTDERLSDTQVGDLKERVKLINEQNPVLAVSIHQNSYQDESVKGPQVFYYTDSKEGEAAAGFIQKALMEMDEENTKQIKANRTYYLLKNTEVPVVIAECGFLSNYEEAEKLVSQEYQETVAAAITEGILAYMDSN